MITTTTFLTSVLCVPVVLGTFHPLSNRAHRGSNLNNIYTREDIACAEKEIGKNLTESLRRLRDDMKTGVPELGMPVLDPLELVDIELSPIIGSDIFSVQLKDIKITGLSNCELRDTQPNLFRLHFPISVHYPLIEVESQYSANGSIFSAFDVQGGGLTTLEFHDVHARTTLYMKIDNETLTLQAADTPLLDFRTIKIKVQGRDIAPEGKPPSRSGMAEQLAPILFWMMAHKVTKQLEQPLETYVNNILKDIEVPEAVQEIHRPIDFYLLRELSDILRPAPYRMFPPAVFH